MRKLLLLCTVLLATHAVADAKVVTLENSFLQSYKVPDSLEGSSHARLGEDYRSLMANNHSPNLRHFETKRNYSKSASSVIEKILSTAPHELSQEELRAVETAAGITTLPHAETRMVDGKIVFATWGTYRTTLIAGGINDVLKSVFTLIALDDSANYFLELSFNDYHPNDGQSFVPEGTRTDDRAEFEEFCRSIKWRHSNKMAGTAEADSKTQAKTYNTKKKGSYEVPCQN